MLSADTLFICSRHCGISATDIVKSNLVEDRELHMPAYMLAVDHATKTVVLSVRGTFSMQDTVTDLVCDSAGERGSTICATSIGASFFIILG